MTIRIYVMTPGRRARILSRAARREEHNAPPEPGTRKWSEREHVRCHACGDPILVLSWTVSRSGKNTWKQYHYRCWKWGGVPDRLPPAQDERGRYARAPAAPAP